MNRHDQLPTWGQRPPSRIDWAEIRFLLIFPTVIALVAHFGGALR